MQIGMIRLGRMGANMAERLRRGGHEVIGYDRDPANSEAASLEELVSKLGAPRIAWVMVPAGRPTDELCELAARAFDQEGGDLSGLEPYVEDSGEGRWTIEDAIDKRVPTPVLSTSLYERYSSRGRNAFAAKLNAALRNQFGGHAVKSAKPL